MPRRPKRSTPEGARATRAFASEVSRLEDAISSVSSGAPTLVTRRYPGVDFANTVSGSTDTAVLTFPGAAMGDVVLVGSDSTPTTGAFLAAYVAASHTVHVTFVNLSGLANDPAPQTLLVTILKALS